jgi:hypothetical protein
MNTPKRLWKSGPALVATVLGACVSSAPRETSDQREARSIAATLEATGSADSLVAAALVRHVLLREPRDSVALLDRAASLSPGQADIAWLTLMVCFQSSACDLAARAEQVVTLDPRNAAGHYVGLVKALDQPDVNAEDRALAAMAGSEYFDLYWSRLITRTTDALATTQPLHRAVAQSTGWLSAIVIPPFQHVSQTCSDERMERAEVLARCRELAMVFDRGDTLLAQSFGRSIAYRAWPPDSPEFAAFRKRDRHATYLLVNSPPLEKSLAEREASAQRWLASLRANRDELQAQRQQFLAAGIPPDPPDGN